MQTEQVCATFSVAYRKDSNGRRRLGPRMAGEKPDEWERLLRQLTTAGQGAVRRGLDDLASLLDRYQPKERAYKGPLLSVAEYDALLESQGGGCAICGDVPKGRLVVDHEHETGRVRGLLCSACNVALGFFKDDPRRLASAANYLQGAGPHGQG